jgi:ribosomal protein L40E
MIVSMKQFCSKCGAKNPRIGQRYCLSCHRAYMRKYRSEHVTVSLSPKEAKAVREVLKKSRS